MSRIPDCSRLGGPFFKDSRRGIETGLVCTSGQMHADPKAIGAKQEPESLFGQARADCPQLQSMVELSWSRWRNGSMKGWWCRTREDD